MPSSIVRKRAITSISTAITEYAEASSLESKAFIGRIREIAALRILEPFLPEDFKIKRSGKIIDAFNNESNEVDLIICSNKNLPKIMFGQEEVFFPAENVYFAIEVKSKVTSDEIRDAHNKAKTILDKIRYLSGFFDENNTPIETRVNPALPALFGFSSDLKDGGKDELTRYKEIVGAEINRGLTSFCIIGKGYWWRDKSGSWFFKPPSPEYDEVIDFLSMIVNTLHSSDERRGHPRLGTYLMIERPKEEFK
jgi:Domain of unknown function (DUF6602)